MCDPIQSIATRLRGLREALELTQEEVAASCNLPVGQYREMESGTADFSVNVLQTKSRRTLPTKTSAGHPKKKSVGMKDYFFAFLLPNLELEHTHIYFHQLREHAYIRQANAYEQILPKL